jgi:VTC domain
MIPHTHSVIQSHEGGVLAVLAEPHPKVAPQRIDRVQQYELKFVLDETQAQAVMAWARENMARDPYADPAMDYAYRVVSLYFDTPQMDVFFRRGSFKRTKYRVRRYGDQPFLYLERKSKSRDQVRKRRTRIHASELLLLQDDCSPPAPSGREGTHTGLSSRWFHKRLVDRRLEPACQVTYERVAFTGDSVDDPMRLTLDWQIRCTGVKEWIFEDREPALILLPRKVILELKFPACLPTAFKNLIRHFQLIPTSVSKYRLSIEAGHQPFGCGRIGHA